MSNSRSNHFNQIVSAWLAAARKSAVNEPEIIEELALAAYQIENWEMARFWIDRSHSLISEWLNSKLCLRAGKTNEALALIENVEQMFSIEQRETNAPAELKDILDVNGCSPRDHIRAELGVLHMARGNYAEALDWFLRAGFWLDAAYVADRVLTVDELKSYVDRAQVDPSHQKRTDEKPKKIDEEDGLSQSLRYLLARRLTRMLRGNEAREYYPAAWQPAFDALADVLERGWNESLTAAKRARALLIAGWITRTNGLDLIGTEVNPDCHIYQGNDQTTLTASWRTNNQFTLFPACGDEQRRYADHCADPEVRFHYRYQAAFLGWEAARWLPDNSHETAQVLSVSASWIKAADPRTADLFYKSLVRRCRRTTAGLEADRIRWFPKFDENGQIIPRKSRENSRETSAGDSENVDSIDTGTDEATPEFPLPGLPFIIEAGDTLDHIAQAVTALGQPMTVQQLLDANPGIEEGRLSAGQKILIPIQAR